MIFHVFRGLAGVACWNLMFYWAISLKIPTQPCLLKIKSVLLNSWLVLTPSYLAGCWGRLFPKIPIFLGLLRLFGMQHDEFRFKVSRIHQYLCLIILLST